MNKLKTKQPLVSILIPNFNHGRYLKDNIESALNQTYQNKEIILLDNGSSDDSVQIAMGYQDRGVRVNRNQANIMNHSYGALQGMCQGKYFILLCADDYIEPTFIEKAVQIMEKYPSVGYVHGEKDFVTEDGEVIETDPFYKCSFVAPGRTTMPVYMVTTVAHPAQAVVRREAFRDIGGYDMVIDHMNGDRALWFYLSYNYDAAYIREKLCKIRIGQQTETVTVQANFQHPILCHLTIKDFIKFARAKDIPEVYNREGEALERLAGEFVGYASGMLYAGDFRTADMYLKYAEIVCRKVTETERYKLVEGMLSRGIADKEAIREMNRVNYAHRRSYEPPEGYIEIRMEELS